MQSSSPSPLPYEQMDQPSREHGGQSPGRLQSIGLLFCSSVAHNLTQICLAGVIISAFIIANIPDLTNSLGQHIMLCTLGYFILMAQAILGFSSFGWATNLKYENKRLIHLSMQILGSILAISGIAIRMITNISHFNSSHGMCGFIALILAVVSLIGGLLGMVFPKQLNTKFMKILHLCMCTVTLATALITVLLAFHLYYRQLLGDINANLAIFLTVSALVGTLLMATRKIAQRILNK